MNINKLNSQILKEKTTIVLDWLSIYFFVGTDTITEPTTTDNNEDKTFSLEFNNLTLVYTGTGQKHFKYIWNIFLKDEHVADILTHTRNEKFFKKNICKVDFKNHLFYNNEIWNVFNEIENIPLIYKGIGRVDIAIDGTNYLIKLLRQYNNQKANNKKFEFKGNVRLSSKILDKQTMLYQNYTFGSPKSAKYLTIYNKSLDIIKKGKDYIQDFFLKNKITNEIIPSDIIKNRHNKTKELIHIDGYKNIFRLELRMTSKVINEIKDFDIDLLKSSDGLMSIIKFMCHRFFELVIIDNKKISRCETIDILPYKKYNIQHLQKINQTNRTDLYKTKMSLHKNVKQLILGNNDIDNFSVYEMIMFDIENQKLYKWFYNKFNKEWSKTYISIQKDKEHGSKVLEAINEQIIDKIKIYIKEDNNKEKKYENN